MPCDFKDTGGMHFIASRSLICALWLLFSGAGNFTPLTDQVGAAPPI